MKQSKKFTLSYPELSQRGDRVQTVVKRDASEFVKYGYIETISDTVREKTEQFKNILPDMFWEGQKTLTTNAKDQRRGILVEILGEISFKAKLALGANSTEYATFRFGGLDRLSDPQLVQYSKHVCKTADFFKESLATRNLTEDIIAEAISETTALDLAIDAQTEAIAVREEKSVERLKIGNELYELILELCDVGKRIWENKNEAFYHDYVLYGSSKSSSKTENQEPVISETEE